MASVKYLGTYPDNQVDDDGKPYIEQYGYTFSPGKAVDVKDEYHLEKLTGNRFFEVSGESDRKEVDAAKQEAEANEAQELRAWLEAEHVPAHHKLGVDKLRQLKADHLKAQAAAQEG